MKRKLMVMILVLALSTVLAAPAMAADPGDPVVLMDAGHYELAVALQEASESYDLTGVPATVVLEDAEIHLGLLPPGLWSNAGLDIEDGVTLIVRNSTIFFTTPISASDIHVWDGGALILDDGSVIEWGTNGGHIWIHNNFGDPGFLNARKGVFNRGAVDPISGVNSIKNMGIIQLAYEGQAGEIANLTSGPPNMGWIGTVDIVPFADYTEFDAAVAFAESLNQKLYTRASWAVLAEALAQAKAVYHYLEPEDQGIVDHAANTLQAALEALKCVTDPRYVSIIETSKNSRVWVLTFNVTMVYGDGAIALETYKIELNGNNANLDGKYTFPDGHELAGFTLTYDIKGNGSNIKTFEIAQK